MKHACGWMVLILVALSLSACATLPPADHDDFAAWDGIPLAEPGSGIDTPKVIRRVDPIASAELRRSMAQATAEVEAIISEEGRVEAVRVLSGSPEWGRAVADALRHWTFEPALIDGAPVKVRFRMTSTFSRNR
jgi:TonB family protein